MPAGGVLLGALRRVQETSAHDRLDGAMFWGGLMMVTTPLVIGLSVAAYLWWQKKARKRNDSSPNPGP